MHDAVPNPARDRLQACFNAQKRARVEQGDLSPERRDKALGALAEALVRRADDFTKAIAADFGHRSPHETKLADLHPVIASLRHARRHFRRWMMPRRRPI